MPKIKNPADHSDDACARIEIDLPLIQIRLSILWMALDNHSVVIRAFFLIYRVFLVLGIVYGVSLLVLRVLLRTALRATLMTRSSGRHFEFISW